MTGPASDDSWSPDVEAAAAWGGNGALGELDTLLWRSERHPVLSNTAVMVELLDREPDWQRLREACAWAADFVPVLHKRVVEPALNMGTPMWVDDDAFDLDFHLRRVQLPDPGGEDELLRIAEEVALDPFDRSRPLWQATLVTGLGDRAAFLLKLHHAMCDGLGAMQLLRLLHSPSRQSTRDKPQVPADAAGPRSVAEVTAHQLQRQLGRAPGLAARLVTETVSRAGHPLRTAEQALDLTRSVGRTLRSPSPPSPLFRDRSGERWTFSMADAPMDELKRAGKAAGGTLNDAFLAIVLGAAGAYHRRAGEPVETLSVFMPVSVRRPDEDGGGNRMVASRFAGPAGIDDPAARIGAIHDIVRAARGEPALEAINAAAPLLNRLPMAVGGLAMAQLGVDADIAASNVPGLRETAYLAGARIDRLYGFGPLPGSALLATLNSHGDTACIAINADGSVIRDADVFRGCVRDAIDEVLALA